MGLEPHNHRRELPSVKCRVDQLVDVRSLRWELRRAGEHSAASEELARTRTEPPPDEAVVCPHCQRRFPA